MRAVKSRVVSNRSRIILLSGSFDQHNPTAIYRLHRVSGQRQGATRPLSRQNLVTEIWILQPKKTFHAEGLHAIAPFSLTDIQTFMPVTDLKLQKRQLKTRDENAIKCRTMILRQLSYIFCTLFFFKH